MYLFLKHSHSLVASLVVVFFAVRLFWKVRGCGLLQTQWVRLSARVLDVLLLVMGLGLWHLLGWFLMPWFGLKMMAVVCYVLCAFFSLNRSSTPAQQLIWGFGAMASLVTAMLLAVFKPWLF